MPAHPIAPCPRCRRSTASPFGAFGVCLRCAGLRALALDLDDSGPPIVAPAAPPPGTYSPFGGIPEAIGPYEIIDEIGRGGMGRVFAARQPRLDRLIALKVLPENPATAALAPRFLREVQTIARLRHPHIVALHDSGRADGYVYFSMDYIEGGDLARRLRENPPAPRFAATLMQKVAAALAYAHAEGVLHRDLKPSNILLDGDEPRLADFGLAAQLAPGGDLTAVSAVLGTPHYLAPEAVKGGSGAFTVAGDLYSLGVVLYELLAGRTPFAGASAAELPALLASAEPPPLRLLSPATPRDLATICLKCLEREPARRYATAAALADDLRRLIDGEPIHARPPGAMARFRRFARRHRTLLIATGATGAALTAGIGVSTALAVRATRAERSAATDAATTRAFAEFLEHDLLLQAAPSNHADRDLKLRTVLDTAAKKIGPRFEHQPAVEAALRETLGETYLSLGEYPQAEEHFGRALALRRQLGGETPASWRLESLLATALTLHARYPEAAAQLAPALAAQRRTLGPDHADTMASTAVLARIYHGQDKLALALALRRTLLAQQRRLLGPENRATLQSATLLATTLLDLGQFPEAVALLEPTAAACRRILGPDDPDTLEALNDLAGACWALGRLAEAEPLFREAIASARRVLGPTHPDTTTTINNLAYVLRSQGKWAEAAALYQEALAAYVAVLGPEHHDVMRTTGALAVVYQKLGRLAEARRLLEQNLALGVKTLGPRHPETASGRDALAGVLVAQGDFAGAEPLLRTALADHLATDERPAAACFTRSLLGGCLTGLGRYEEAERELLAGYAGEKAIADKLTPTQKQSHRDTIARLGQLYAAWGKPEEARMWHDRFAAESATPAPR